MAISSGGMGYGAYRPGISDVPKYVKDVNGMAGKGTKFVDGGIGHKTRPKPPQGTATASAKPMKRKRKTKKKVTKTKGY